MAGGVQVTVSGPVLEGRTGPIMDAYLDEATDVVAQEAYDLVRSELRQVLRHPTGYYESRVQVENRRSEAEVTDGGVIYGPWLEGVGSRNARTRFRGYATFRRVRQRVQARAGDIAERVMPRYLDRLNG